MADFEVLIIGAGVVGLAIGRQLAEDGFSVAILEKEKHFGLGTSSRNSEVLHSGIHYPRGSLKACLCVEGNHLMVELLKKQGLMYGPVGKITVASCPEEVAILEALYQQGRQNSVPGMQLLSQTMVNRLEPEVKAEAGLLTPTTGLLNVHQLMDFLAFAFQEAGGLLAFSSPVAGLEKTGSGYQVRVVREKEERYTAEKVINSAGLFADEVAGYLGLKYHLYWARGDYFSLHQPLRVERLIYPVPNPASLGIHLTPRLGGGYRLGPDLEYVEKRIPPYPGETAQPPYRVQPDKSSLFYQEVRRYLPCLKEEAIVPESYGLRAKLQGPGEPFCDFVIRDEAAQGFPGFINLVGIESPGLTASLAIARYVRRLL
ncbi:MAG TPA: NAD(P)/FAD-dependent oxidoreductase [bacterium]|nr:NAD(P)/FAD-dependent oxidoreductase [bacterium]